MPGFVVSLSSRRARDERIAGGKGAGLARLLKSGFPVPAGFVVTTAAFREPLSQAAARAGSPDLVLGPDSDPDPAALEAARRACLSWPMPDRLRRSVLAAYRRLGAGPVAVRSSLVGEDSGAASFAGQLDTVLGVDGEDALLDAVRRVLASAYRRPPLGLREARLRPPTPPPSALPPFAGRRRPVHGPRPRSRASPSAPTPSPARTASSSRPSPAWARTSSRAASGRTAIASIRAASSPRSIPRSRPARFSPRPMSAPWRSSSAPSPRRPLPPRTSSGPGTPTASGSSNPGRSHRSRGAASTRAGSSPRWPRARPAARLVDEIPQHGQERPRPRLRRRPQGPRPRLHPAHRQDPFAGLHRHDPGRRVLRQDRLPRQLLRDDLPRRDGRAEADPAAAPDGPRFPPPRPVGPADPRMARGVGAVHRGPGPEARRVPGEGLGRRERRTGFSRTLDRLKALHADSQRTIVSVSINMVIRNRMLGRMIVKRAPGARSGDVIKGYGKSGGLAPFEEMRELAATARALDPRLLAKAGGGRRLRRGRGPGRVRTGPAAPRRVRAVHGPLRLS